MEPDIPTDVTPPRYFSHFPFLPVEHRGPWAACYWATIYHIFLSTHAVSFLICVYCRAGKKPSFLEKVFRFIGFLVYERRTQNYDREIHEEYLVHDNTLPLPHDL